VVRRIAIALSLSLSLGLGLAAGSAHAAPGNLGLMVDAGVPDGLTGSLVYRPHHLVNVHAGLGTNTIGVGVRTGATLYLLPTAIAPSLNVEIGHYFAGNANVAMRRFGIDSDSPLLRHVGYDYANLHLGLDVGRKRMSFYFHAGFSILRSTVHNLDDVVAEDANENLTFRVGEDPIATLVTPSARLGFVFFF
jgi:hypothetical protein